ncbi:MAG: S-layer homology domain-containing protein [Candidatus Ornithomonoglobus sp.]
MFNDVPKSHWASDYIYNTITMDWIKGYADGTFKPDSNITRAEVVAIINRVTDREADTEYVDKNISSLNRFSDLIDKGYWAWNDIIEAANTHMAVWSADGEAWVK